MSKIVAGFFLVVFTSAFCRVWGSPTFAANDDGTVTMFLDPEEYGKF
jgi:hypothetical protein